MCSPHGFQNSASFPALIESSYFPLVYQQKNEGQRCASCSLLFRGREGMSWEPVLCQFQLLAELLGLRYIRFIHSETVVSQAVWASSGVGYFWKKSVLLHLSFCQHVCQRGCTRNESMLINITWYKKKNKKKKLFCSWISFLILLLL